MPVRSSDLCPLEWTPPRNLPARAYLRSARADYLLGLGLCWGLGNNAFMFGKCLLEAPMQWWGSGSDKWSPVEKKTCRGEILRPLWLTKVYGTLGMLWSSEVRSQKKHNLTYECLIHIGLNPEASMYGPKFMWKSIVSVFTQIMHVLVCFHVIASFS